MKITLKLFATLSEYLPPGAVRNAVEMHIDDGISVAGLLARCDVPEASAHLVLCNGLYVAPEQRAATLLAPGDVLAVWPPVAGG